MTTGASLASGSTHCTLSSPSAVATPQRPLPVAADATLPPMKLVLPTKSATNLLRGRS